MVIGLVLSSIPGYSETFFRNKIKFLTESGAKVIVFASNIDNKKVDYNLVEGFSWKGSWKEKIRILTISASRLVLSPRKTVKLWKMNKQSGFQTRKNFLSILSSAHILRFDLDWLHFGFATAALGKENIAKVLNANMAVSIRGYDIAISPIKSPDCYQLLWQRINKLHYISDDLLSLAIKQGFKVETPKQKITPAIDTFLFKGKKGHSFTKPIKIVTVGRLHWKKGFEYTLIGLSLLNKKGVDFEYTIIGEGEEYERLKFTTHQLGIKEKVNFVGKLSQREIKKTFQESAIYLQYSIQEGFCNAVLEAQAEGLLCIVSNAEGLSENVLDEHTGWVVPKRNPTALANQIYKVLNLSVSDRARISQAAIERVEKKFNLDQQKKGFETFYKN